MLSWMQKLVFSKENPYAVYILDRDVAWKKFKECEDLEEAEVMFSAKPFLTFHRQGDL